MIVSPRSRGSYHHHSLVSGGCIEPPPAPPSTPASLSLFFSSPGTKATPYGSCSIDRFKLFLGRPLSSPKNRCYLLCVFQSSAKREASAERELSHARLLFPVRGTVKLCLDSSYTFFPESMTNLVPLSLCY